MARYDAFVLRVWRSGTGDQGQWAGKLEHLPDGAVLRFSSVESLLAYLCAELVVERAAGEALGSHLPVDGERSGARTDTTLTDAYLT